MFADSLSCGVVASQLPHPIVVADSMDDAESAAGMSIKKRVHLGAEQTTDSCLVLGKTFPPSWPLHQGSLCSESARRKALPSTCVLPRVTLHSLVGLLG